VDGSRTLGPLMEKVIVLRSSAGDHTVRILDGRITVDGAEVEPPHRAWAIADGDTRWVFFDGDVYEFEVSSPGRTRSGAHPGSLAAPMPATVVRIDAPAGTRVKRGDTLIVLEAMKMELPVRANTDGTVAAVHCQVGELVQPGVLLIEIS
jgi:3-methylcrotonyl-CoA carboxylase alpha subunit